MSRTSIFAFKARQKLLLSSDEDMSDEDVENKPVEGTICPENKGTELLEPMDVAPPPVPLAPSASKLTLETLADLRLAELKLEEPAKSTTRKRDASFSNSDTSSLAFHPIIGRFSLSDNSVLNRDWSQSLASDFPETGEEDEEDVLPPKILTPDEDSLALRILSSPNSAEDLSGEENDKKYLMSSVCRTRPRGEEDSHGSLALSWRIDVSRVVKAAGDGLLPNFPPDAFDFSGCSLDSRPVSGCKELPKWNS
jgi:hypothetical protein